jgi:hypothetical protein
VIHSEIDLHQKRTVKNMLASMYEWLTVDMLLVEKSARMKKQNYSNARFATLNSNCEVECGTFIGNEDDSEDEE